MKQFNFRLFFVVTLVLVVITYFSFIAAFDRDDGVSQHSHFNSFLVYLFNILRFPTHFLLKKLTQKPLFFSVGLLVNCMFYSLAFERTLFYINVLRNPNDSLIEE